MKGQQSATSQVCHTRQFAKFLVRVVQMNDRKQLFAHYEAGIVAALDPEVMDADAAWSDPALFCVLRHESCAVITACNPGFVQYSREVNERRNEQLRTRLVLSGYGIWESLNTAPDGTFEEPGFLVWGITQERACELAAAFAQFAIYWYDETGARSVIGCDYAVE